MEQACIRREVSFCGHVQGVGFRYTTCKIANNYNIKGYVQNMPDGTVQLVVEGSSHELNSFLAEIHEVQCHYIDQCKETQTICTHEFTEFSIRT